METYLKVGTIIKTYGLQGQVKVFLTTDFPELRFKKGNKVFLFDEKSQERIEILVNRYQQIDSNIAIVSFKNITSINDVEKYLKYEIHVVKDDSILPDDTYYYSDLENCEVFNEDGTLISKVKKVENFNGKLSLRLESNLLIPFNNFFIKKVIIEERKIFVHLIEGML